MNNEQKYFNSYYPDDEMDRQIDEATENKMAIWVLPLAVSPLIITLLLVNHEQAKNNKHCFCWEVKEFNF